MKNQSKKRLLNLDRDLGFELERFHAKCSVDSESPEFLVPVNSQPASTAGFLSPEMMIVSPLTPGQVSFFLGVISVIVAWTYAEILEHRKSLIPSKVHSDINLVELGNETVKEDDRALLLEGGGLQSASSNARTPTATSPILSNLRQLRNLEKALGGDVRVCDRTALILDIFNQRAATHEASLQVALAQLEYQLPRLTKMWTHLERQSGGQVKGMREKTN